MASMITTILGRFSDTPTERVEANDRRKKITINDWTAKVLAHRTER